MVGSYVLYVGLLVICYFFGNIASEKEDKVYVFFIIMILSLVAGLRSYSFANYVAIDTIYYAQGFRMLAAGKFHLVYWEPGYEYLCFLISRITNNLTVLFLFNAILTYGLIFLRLWDFRKIGSFGIMCACFYAQFYLRSLNNMRQFCAIAIVFFASRYIYQKRYILFLLGILAAMAFHNSSFIGMLLLVPELFSWKELNRKQKRILGVFVLLIPFAYFQGNEILGFYSNYFQTAAFKGGYLIITKVLLVLITYLYSSYWRSGSLSDQFDNFSYISAEHIRKSVTICYLIGLLLTSAGYYYEFMDRIGLYMYLFEGIYYGILLKRNDTKTYSSIQMFGLLGILVTVGYPFYAVLKSDSFGVIPYALFYK